MKRRRTAPEPPQPAVDVNNVMVRLDAIVDRLEGVYDRLIPVVEARMAERRGTPAPQAGGEGSA